MSLITKKLDYSDVLSHVAACITGGVVGIPRNANLTRQPALLATTVNTTAISKMTNRVVILSFNDAENPDFPFVVAVLPASFDATAWNPVVALTSTEAAGAFFTFNGVVTAKGPVAPINYSYQNVGVFPCDSTIASAGVNYQLSDNYSSGYPVCSKLEITCPMINPGGGAALAGTVTSNQLTLPPPAGQISTALVTGTSIGPNSQSLTQTIDRKTVIVQRTPPKMKFFDGAAVNPSGQTLMKVASFNLTQQQVLDSSPVPQVAMSSYTMELPYCYKNFETILKVSGTFKNTDAFQKTINVTLLANWICVKKSGEDQPETGAILSKRISQVNLTLAASQVSSQYTSLSAFGYAANPSTVEQGTSEIWQFLGFTYQYASNPASAPSTYVFGPTTYLELNVTIPLGEVSDDALSVTVVQNAEGLPLDIRREIKWFVNPNPESIAVFGPALQPPAPMSFYEDVDEALLAVYGSSYGAVFSERAYDQICDRASNPMGLASLISSDPAKTFDTPHSVVDVEHLQPYEALAAPRPQAFFRKLGKTAAAGLKYAEKAKPYIEGLSSLAEGRPSLSTASSRYLSSGRGPMDTDPSTLSSLICCDPTPIIKGEVIEAHQIPPGSTITVPDIILAAAEVKLDPTSPPFVPVRPVYPTQAEAIIQATLPSFGGKFKAKKGPISQKRAEKAEFRNKANIERLNYQRKLSLQIRPNSVVPFKPDEEPVPDSVIATTMRGLLEKQTGLLKLRKTSFGGTIKDFHSAARFGQYELTFGGSDTFVLTEWTKVYIPTEMMVLIHEFDKIPLNSAFLPPKFNTNSLFDTDSQIHTELLRLIILLLDSPLTTERITHFVIEQLLRSQSVYLAFSMDSFVIYLFEQLVSRFTGYPFLRNKDKIVELATTASKQRYLYEARMLENWLQCERDHHISLSDIEQERLMEEDTAFYRDCTTTYEASGRGKVKLPKAEPPYMIVQAAVEVAIETTLEVLADAATSIVEAATDFTAEQIEAAEKGLVKSIKAKMEHKSSSRTDGGDTLEGLRIPCDNMKYSPELRADHLNMVGRNIKRLKKRDPRLHTYHEAAMAGRDIPSAELRDLEKAVHRSHYQHHSMPRKYELKDGGDYVPGGQDDIVDSEDTPPPSERGEDEEEGDESESDESESDTDFEPAFEQPTHKVLNASTILSLGHMGASYSWGLANNPLLASVMANLTANKPMKFKGVNTASFPTINVDMDDSEPQTTSIMTLLVSEKPTQGETYRMKDSTGKDLWICLSEKFTGADSFRAARNVEKYLKDTGVATARVYVNVAKDLQDELPQGSVSGPSFGLALTMALIGVPSGPILTGEVLSDGSIKAVGQQVTKAAHFMKYGIVVPHDKFQSDFDEVRDKAQASPPTLRLLEELERNVHGSATTDFFKRLPDEFVYKAYTVRDVLGLYVFGSLSGFSSPTSPHRAEIEENVRLRAEYERDVARTSINQNLISVGIDDPSLLSRKDLDSLLSQMESLEKFKGRAEMIRGLLSQQSRVNKAPAVPQPKKVKQADDRAEYYRDQAAAYNEVLRARSALIDTVSKQNLTLVGADGQPLSNTELPGALKMLKLRDQSDSGGVTHNQRKLIGVLAGKTQRFELGNKRYLEVFLPEATEKAVSQRGGGSKVRQKEELSTLLKTIQTKSREVSPRVAKAKSSGEAPRRKKAQTDYGDL